MVLNREGGVLGRGWGASAEDSAAKSRVGKQSFGGPEDACTAACFPQPHGPCPGTKKQAQRALALGRCICKHPVGIGPWVCVGGSSMLGALVLLSPFQRQLLRTPEQPS